MFGYFDNNKYEKFTTDDDSRIQRIFDAENALLDNLVQNVESEWGEIRQKFGDKIKQYDIELDENDKAQIEAEDKTKNSDYINATKVDKLKKMNKTLKLVFSTVAKTMTTNTNGVESTLEMSSSIGGVQTLPFTKVTNTLMKNLHKSVNLMDMLERFQQLAQRDPDYRTLYYDFTGLKYTDDISLNVSKLITSTTPGSPPIPSTEIKAYLLSGDKAIP